MAWDTQNALAHDDARSPESNVQFWWGPVCQYDLHAVG